MTGAEPQVDLPVSEQRGLGAFFSAASFVAISGLCAYYAREQLGAWSGVELVMYGGVLIGLAATARAVRALVRRGPVVSIGAAGILDRRVSDGWIPWSAIRSMSVVTSGQGSVLMLDLYPAHDERLPIRTIARQIAAVNAKAGFTGYAVVSQDVAGGFPAIAEAVRRFAPPHLQAGPEGPTD